MTESVVGVVSIILLFGSFRQSPFRAECRQSSTRVGVVADSSADTWITLGEEISKEVEKHFSLGKLSFWELQSVGCKDWERSKLSVCCQTSALLSLSSISEGVLVITESLIETGKPAVFTWVMGRE